MFKKLSLAGAAIAMGATAVVPVAPAMAQSRYYDQSRTYRGDTYRGETYRQYRMRQKCNDGDGGTIVGAIAGGLLGRTIAGRGDHLLGTVLGAGAGALAGRAIDRSDRPNYCRR
jgi:uncharacterized protein YcfJ